MIGAFSILDIKFWLYFLYYIFAVFVSAYIPGSLLLRTLKVDKFSKIIISLVLGIVIWGYQGYIFGYIGLRFLSYIYLSSVFIFWIHGKRKNKWSFIPTLGINKSNLFSAAIIFVGTLVQLLTIWFNGVYLQKGLYFCCGIDTVYHLALTGEAVRHFPPLDPGSVNAIVKNYHYFSNVIIAEWVRVFNLPLTATYFQYSTVLFSILMGLTAVVFGRVYGMKKRYINWLLFFLYFSGSATYILILLFQHRIDIGATVLHEATILWLSPPRVYAIVVFLTGMSLIYYWIKGKNIHIGLIAAILLASLISIKVYFGIFILAGYMFLNIYYLYKKDLKSIIPSLIAIVVALLLYLPVNSGAGGLFFTGFWRVENFISFPALGLSHMELARLVYLEHHNWLRVAQYEGMYIALYFFAVFGTLLFSFCQTGESMRKIPKEAHIFLIGGITVSLIAGLFFVQRFGASNSSQFIITVIGILPIYAALAYDHWIQKIKAAFIRRFIILIVIFVTIPRIAHDVNSRIQQFTHLSGYTFSNQEIAATSFLREAPNGIVLTPLYNCLYIHMLSNKFVYACNDANVLTDHLDANEANKKIADINKIFTYEQPSSVSAALLSKNIRYIYIRGGSDLISTNSAFFLPIIYKNNEIKIREVSKKKINEYNKLHLN